MPTFVYTARDNAGSPVSGQLVAETVTEVTQLLRRDGKYPTSVQAGGDGPASSSTAGGASASAGGGRKGIKISRAEVIQVSTQLAIMVETGVTLTEALECIAQQSDKPKVKELLDDVVHTVHSGTDLSTALSRHERSFPRLYISLIRASEKSGMMAKLLSRATHYLRDEQETLRRVKGALIYPSVMLGFAVLTTVFLLAFVLPKFTAIYAQLPAADRPRFDGLDVTWKVRNQVAEFDRFDVHSKLLAAYGKGKLGFDGYLDVEMEIDNLLGDSADPFVMPLISYLAQNVVSFHLHGYLRDLHAEKRWVTESAPRRRAVTPMPPTTPRPQAPDF